MKPFDDAAVREMRALDDDAFLRACEWQAFRGSGPGGQKRNKTSSGVRIVHPPTGLSAVATVKRSQQANLHAALRSLRLELAFSVRRDPPPMPTLPTATPAMKIYAAEVAAAFDVLEANAWSLANAAEAMGTTTGQLAAWLTHDPIVLAAANRQRRARGQRILQPRE